MNDTITKDQVLAAYNNAPDIVRAVFNAELTTKIILEIRNKYKLHIDSAGILAKEVGYLLLGITDPAKFMNRLKASGVDAQTVSNIAKDINEKIFIPLQQQMRKGSPASPKATQGTAPMVPSPRPSAPLVATRAQLVTSQSAARPASRFNLQNKIPPPAPASRTVPGSRLDLRSVLASVTSEVPKTKLLEDHEEPHLAVPSPAQPKSVSPLPQKTVVASVPPRPAATPFAGTGQRSPTFQGGGASRYVPTPNLTGAPRATFNAPPAPRPSPLPNALIPGITLPPPTQPPIAPTPPPKSPSGDPYREPIE